MTTIQYREIILDGCRHAEIVDEQHSFDLKHFAEACGQSPEWVLQLLEYDICLTDPITAFTNFLVMMSHVHGEPIAYNVTLMPALLQSQ